MALEASPTGTTHAAELPSSGACGCGSAITWASIRRRFSFQSHSDSLSHFRGKLTKLRARRELHDDRFLGDRVHDVRGVGGRVGRDHRTCNIAECACDQFVGVQFGSVVAASATCAKLVARPDLIKGGRLRVIKFHRVGSIPANDGSLRYPDDSRFLTCKGCARNRNGPGGGIDRGDEPARSTPLPVL